MLIKIPSHRGGIVVLQKLEWQHIRCCYKGLQHIKVGGVTGKILKEISSEPKCWHNLRSSPTTDGTFTHYGNKWVEVDHVRNHLITSHWCIQLTNVRQITNNDNACQGILVQSNKFE